MDCRPFKELIQIQFCGSPQKPQGIDYSTPVDFPRVTEFLAAKHCDYAKSNPYPHLVIDDFLPESTMQLLLEQYPLDQDRKEWIHSIPSRSEVQTETRLLRDVLAMPKAYLVVV